MSSSNITIKDIAKRAGVSIATVSRFLNNPSSLRKKNFKKIEEAVKTLNYEPLVYARRLAGGKLDTFGLIIPGYEGVFYSFFALEIIRNIAASMNEKGIDMHLSIFWGKDNFRSSLVDGVIFSDIVGNYEQLTRLLQNKVPTVVINRKVHSFDVSFVAVDNFKGAYEATEFLIRHNHKRIAHLSGSIQVQCAKDRLDGFKSALLKEGIKAKDEYIKCVNFSSKEARGALEELFSLEKPPTAIFCCSDEVAKEVLVFAKERDIEIPKKMSIIGFDDNPFMSYDNLMLTTVRQPFQQMTSMAVDILQDIVKGKKSVKSIILEPELIIRDTVDFI